MIGLYKRRKSSSLSLLFLFSAFLLLSCSPVLYQADPTTVEEVRTLSEAVHTITATVTDSGGQTGSTQITLTVGATTTEVRVAAGSDDAEEKGSGSVQLTSVDLDLGSKTVGLRFTDVAIPAGAVIVDAYIEFEADEKDSSSTSLIFHGEATDDAAPFADTNGDISSRSLTAASVSWPDIAAWTVVHETHRTPDLSSIVQGIVDRSGWRSGNAMAFIISGSGSRTAEAYDGKPARAPRLVVEYTVPPPTPTPTATPTPTDTPTPTLTLTGL